MFRPPLDYLERERLAADPDAPTAAELLAENAALKRELAELREAVSPGRVGVRPEYYLDVAKRMQRAALLHQLYSAITTAGMAIGHYPPTPENPLGIGPFAETLERTIAILESR